MNMNCRFQFASLIIESFKKIFIPLSLLTSTIIPAYSHSFNEIDQICSNSPKLKECLLSEFIKRNNYTNLDPPLSLSNSSLQDWLPYGPIIVNWASWTKSRGNSIAQIINKNGDQLFIAINCRSILINVTDKNFKWKAWLTPDTAYEKELYTDYCFKYYIR